MKNNNRKIRTTENWITIGLFGVLFLAMIVYFAIFVKDNEQQLINNSYNSRQKLLALENTRGKILDSNGEVLAESVTLENGKEIRQYPYGSLYAHGIGFSTKGRTGVESMANFYLINSNISLTEKVENDIAGNKNPGNNVYTTFDTSLQKVASDSLGVYKGAIIVSNVKTGEILAMVSKPDFDPNTVAENWDKFASDSSSSVLLNRVTQGLYPPGSTFKIITALEYIRENPDNYSKYSFNCNGRFKQNDIDIKCYHGSVHGGVDFAKSFAKSCNSSFANIGLTFNKSEYGKTLRSLLYNQNLPTDYNYSVSKLTVDELTTDYDLSQIVIGQGKAVITPLQLNLITNAIANKGVMMKPKVLDRIESADGNIIKEYKDEEYGRILSESEADILTELMTGVVQSGTGTKLKSDYYQAAGKTGSAEYNGNKLDSHAWFTGFAPAEDPEISVTIIVEGIGSGGDYAVPIAKRIIDCYYGLN